MSKNNTIKKSDKKFIRREKARIRGQFSDAKKQQELINELYNRFLQKPEVKEISEVKEVKEAKKESVKKVEKKKVVKTNVKKHEKKHNKT